MTLLASMSSFSTELIGGIPDQEIPQEFIVKITKIREYYPNTDYLDAKVYTNRNRMLSNLDCKHDKYFKYVNKFGQDKRIEFESIDVCKVALNCLKKEKQVTLFIDVESLYINAISLPKQCDKNLEKEFQWVNTIEYSDEEQTS